MSYNINALRYCEDIGMWALDLPRSTCVWRTPYCTEHCYNNKLYRLYPAMNKRDEQNSDYWNLTHAWNIAKDIQKAMDHNKGSSERFRFGTRGEFLGTVHDVYKVAAIACTLPHVHFWIPTRAWRSMHTNVRSLFGAGKELYGLLCRIKNVLPNVHMVASLDPSNTWEEEKRLIMDGWNTTEVSSSP